MDSQKFNLVCGSCTSFRKASCPPVCAQGFYSHVLGDTPACVLFQRVADIWDWQPKKNSGVTPNPHPVGLLEL